MIHYPSIMTISATSRVNLQRISHLFLGIFLMFTLGACDNSNPGPEQIGATVIPAVNPELDNVVSVDAIDPSDWSNTQVNLDEGTDWWWDRSTHELSLAQDLTYPLYLRIVGIIDSGVAAGYYTLATHVSNNDDTVAANEITTLISARSIREGESIQDAASSIYTTLGFADRVDAFAAATESTRSPRLQAAMQTLAPYFVTTLDGVDARFNSLLTFEQENNAEMEQAKNAAAGVPVEQTAVIATVAADYSVGAHSVIPVDPPRNTSNNLLPTISDISVVAYGRYFYRLEMFNADNITKFSIDAPATPIWQFSTQDTDGTVSSNPHDLVFASRTKAFLLRYGKSKAWVVNPSTINQQGFKTGEIDLSAYADADGIPEMDRGIVAGGKLFITLQRFDSTSWTPGTAYLAVFDVASGVEIDTGIQNNDGVKGIPLPIKNPGKIQYLSASNKIYVQGVGENFAVPAVYSGGIAEIDPSTYEAILLVGDGDPFGNISQMAIVSDTKGYFVGYAGWGDNSLYTFNPMTGMTQSGPVAGISGINIAGLDVDIHSKLWLLDQSGHGVLVIDPADDSIENTVIDTELDPIAIAFCEQ